ncbi:hypothetical protein H8A97_25525 [Bradyrhizobium sp. Arg62]|uniref:hypothetical protein n=1 Tax=Bradyrhizobium brasilense TaxID=1419277 RepID=UPI001E46A9CD|nr:hypothetical protein [Bradyrhizobium brasilense]MCC8948378.1 hypothetical protein [Bradyrhizobium brasilense]
MSPAERFELQQLLVQRGLYHGTPRRNIRRERMILNLMLRQVVDFKGNIESRD